MNEQAKKVLSGIIILVVFVVSVGLVIVGQRSIGPRGFGTLRLGLAGLIALLWLYNRQYK